MARSRRPLGRVWSTAASTLWTSSLATAHGSAACFHSRMVGTAPSMPAEITPRVARKRRNARVAVPGFRRADGPSRSARACTNAAIVTQNKAVVYGLLFRAVAETLRTIAADPRHLGAEIGFFAVLHTWGQTLVHHPHLHCVIPGGGLATDGSGWVACRPGFFLPVRVLSRYFRRVLVQALEDAFESGRLRFAGRLQPLGDPRRFAEHLRPAREAEWVVYAKRPFAGPEQVLDYLGRYTHASPSATSGCAASKTTACASATRTIAGPARPVRGR